MDAIRAGIENECYIDRYDSEHIELSDQFVIPRPAKYKKLLQKRWGRAFALIIRKMWWLGLLVLLADIFFALLIRLRMQYSLLGGHEFVYINPSKHGSESIGAYRELDEIAKVGMVILTSPIRVVSTDRSCEISCLQLMTYKELMRLAFHAILLYGRLSKFSSDPLFRLHLVRLWRGVINCVLIDKLNALDIRAVVHDNHYDMNAVIIHQIFKRRIVLIQHGQVRSNLVPPCRVRSPEKLYVLDAPAARIFSSCIFSNVAAKIEVVTYRKSLAFVETGYRGFVVLVASRPGDVEAEMKFISGLRLRNLDDLQVIVKPHPLMSGRRVYPRLFLKQNRIIAWKQLYCFPRPSVLVCGQSSMADEFVAYGIPVLDVHSPSVVDAACNLRAAISSHQICDHV